MRVQMRAQIPAFRNPSTRRADTYSVRMYTLFFTLALAQLSLGAQPAPPKPRARAIAPPAVRPAADRIDVVPGRPLVLPIEIVDKRVLQQGQFEAKLDDGLPIEGTLVWIGARVVDPGGWLGPKIEWTSTLSPIAIRTEHRTPGRWYMVCEMPPEAVGLGMWFAGERHRVNWLPDPWRLGRDASGRAPPEMWAGTLPEEAQADEQVQHALEQLTSNPWHRWRARLMLGQLEPQASFSYGWPATPEQRSPAFEGVIQDLARYQDGLWQAAMARLWIGNPDAAIRLRSQLGEVAKFHDAWAPVFPASPVNEHDLRADLLNPFVDEPTLALRAEAWQLSQPAAVVWTIDDSGRTDATRSVPSPTIGILALGDESPLIVLDHQPPEAIKPGIELHRVLQGRPGRTGSEGRFTARRVSVRVGPWRSQVGIVSGVQDAIPPGVSLGPLVRDWTLASWFHSRENEGADTSLHTLATARLFRAGPHSEDWRIYLECRTPKSFIGDEPRNDAVTFWFGPLSSPTAIIRIRADGALYDELNKASLGSVPIAQTEAGWSAVIDLPSNVAERGTKGAGSLMRVGLTRTVQGNRTAWPRRMLPWDTEPGRLIFDLDAWDGF